MATLRWDESLSVGVELIDDQHKTWIKHFNDLSTAVGAVQGPQRVAEALAFLSDYTRFHFSTEEDAMTKHSYPELEFHRAKHSELTQSLSDLEDQYREDGATHVLADAVNQFLGGWLMNHIREVDVRLGAFLKGKGISLSGNG